MPAFGGLVLGTILLAGPFAGVAEAYIGPGAGFALVSSFAMLAISCVLAGLSLLAFPFRALWGARARRRARRRALVDRVVVLGLDGLDPALTERFLAEGTLPNFARLRAQGDYRRLATSYPSISPAAWSSFMTGVDCSHHGVFDFITRDPKTYRPVLSSAEIRPAPPRLRLGRFTLLGGGTVVRGLRKSRTLWSILGDHRVPSAVIRVPITFPPEKFGGVMLSGMCTPDIRGTQGTFTHYSTRPPDGDIEEGGVRVRVTLESGVARTVLRGPDTPDGAPLEAPVTIRVDVDGDRAELAIGSERVRLVAGRYSDWVRVRFRKGLGRSVRGICRFLLVRTRPELDVYVTPVQIDPGSPALRIAHPFVYSVYLAKLLGSYGTLGLAEDTWALNEGVIDEDAFLAQAYLYCEEREAMLVSALDRTPRGLVVCVFDTPDRIQHMFFRCLDPSHPANGSGDAERYRHVIEDVYRRMDALLGRLMARLRERTVLLVMSDHGFVPFRRGVNLNSWLHGNGYLTLTHDGTRGEPWLGDVDWSRTRAFAVGLTGLFINRRGREGQGIVGDDEYRDLKAELRAKLTGLVDEAVGEIAIRDVIDVEARFPGPYLDHGPDLIIGYHAGFRASWASASGRVTDTVFEDNTRRWSGDHCVDPELVPGILFTSHAVDARHAHIQDLAPTVLRLFGVEPPAYMPGRPLIPEARRR